VQGGHQVAAATVARCTRSGAASSRSCAQATPHASMLLTYCGRRCVTVHCVQPKAILQLLRLQCEERHMYNVTDMMPRLLAAQAVGRGGYAPLRCAAAE
jgi:hypothetical protein